MAMKLAVTILFSLTGLAGCVSDTPPPAAQDPVPTAMRTGSPSDESACVDAVRKQTKNNQVIVISSELSQANTDVRLGVGAQEAPWRCLVSNGRVAEVTFLGVG